MPQTIIDKFFQALATTGTDGVLQLVAADAVFEAQGPNDVPIYGRFDGHAGVRRFTGILGEMFDTERFEVRRTMESDGVCFGYGYMQHRVRRTGRVFTSEWALYCEVQNGLISVYKMFEDTAGLTAAYSAESV